MVSIYDVTVPVFIKQLKVLSGLLNKGIAHTGEDKVATILEARLIEDMQPLVYQIQRLSDAAKGLCVRVGGVEPEVFPDNEETFADVQARIAKIIKFLEGVPASVFEGKEDADVVLKAKAGERTYKGLQYVNEFALPNFYFHFVTAYALLRKEGVPIGKSDYLGWR